MDVLAQQIDLEPATGRIDMAIWLLSENMITQKLLQAKARGVPIRLLGDRDAIFEQAVNVRREFYTLACAGIPLRLRYNPTWFPEINHWKATIFKAQGIVAFGSANYAATSLAPYSNDNYHDESVLFSDNPALVGAFLTQFDKMWNDALPYTEASHSIYGDPPYVLNWPDACARESACDFQTWWPQNQDLCPGGPQAMTINTDRLEPDYPTPPDLYWSQGSDPGSLNERLIQEIDNEPTGGRIDLMIYRLSEPLITQALIRASRRGVNVRLIVDWNQYQGPGGRVWPEYELVHANIDQLWADTIAPIRNIKLSAHPLIGGAAHMKTLITSRYATNASSNFTVHWQRDHNYFVSATTNRPIYDGFVSCFQSMYTDTPGRCVPVGGGPHFIDFAPSPADAPELAIPDEAANVSTSPTLVWNRAALAVYYDVYLRDGTQGDFVRVATVNHDVSESYPPTPTYQWTANGLAPGRTYYWKVVSRTYASVLTSSTIRSFTVTATGGSLPAPWLRQDIGATGRPGNASYSAGTFTISGAGADIWAPPDGFHYVYRPLNGNGQITARVVTMQNTAWNAKAGIMIRASLDASAAHVILNLNPSGNIEFMQRPTAGAQTNWLTGANRPAPVWLRLVRSGVTVTASVSSNGSVWTTVGSTTATLPADVYVGLIVCSANTALFNTSTFDNVTAP